MKKILVLDEANYGSLTKEIRRAAVRGIIFKGGKLLMVKTKYGEVKIPGGGIERGENDLEALIREVSEETGYNIKKDSVKPFGLVEEKRESLNSAKIWHQNSFCYFANVYDKHQSPSYTRKERKAGYSVMWTTLDEAIRLNKELLDKEGYLPWNQRDYRTLLVLKDYLEKNNDKTS